MSEGVSYNTYIDLSHTITRLIDERDRLREKLKKAEEGWSGAF